MIYHRITTDLPLRLPQVRRSASPMNNVRQQNCETVLETIFSMDATSRKELCSITSLSASTVGLIVNDLLQKGVLIESGAAVSDRGRKPILIRLDPAFVNILAVDADELSANIYDVNGKALLDPVQLEVSDRPQPADVVRLVKERLATLPEGMKLPGVIGMSVPGSVNAQTGDVQFSSNLGWSNVPLRSLVSSATGIPTIVESNMVCLALTEVWSGLARTDTFAYIHVGWRGIGGGLVFNGEMHRGANSCSAEIGHIQVDPNGPLCCCGKNGCVEVMASGSATLARAKARIAENNMQAADRLTWSGLITEALDGNSIAKETLETTARILGKVAASLVLTVDPGALIFGGRVMEAHEIIMPVIRQMIREQTLRDSLEHLELGVATDSHEKSLAGAARMAARSYLISVC